MKILKLFIIIIFLITNFTKANSNESKDNLVNKISKNIRCLICQGQSIYDSQSDFSISMRLVIKKKLEEGLTEKEIYDFLKDKYGQWITYEPEFNKKTFILWIMPILLFIIGGAILFNRLFVKKY
jgi:cytochrome c-type biogenesis protein CcmH